MTAVRIPVAVLGASGYVGQHFVRLLDDHPMFEAVALTSTERSAGERLSDRWHLAEPPPELAERRLERSGPATLARRGVRVAFSALPSGTAGAVETELTRRGISVFSNAADHRRAPGVPLLVPEVNGSTLSRRTRPAGGRGLLVNNPNCSATGLALALAPLRAPLRPVRLDVTTYQALSGAGYPGVPSLAIADNVVPYIPEEEEKLALETAHLFGRLRGDRVVPARFPILPHCARVGTREGHLEAVTVEAAARPDRTALLSAWRRFDPLRGLDLPTAPHPPIELRAEADRPQPMRDRWAGAPARARGMAAVVGRVRWEPPFLRFFVLSHNAVRGGAGGSVLNAEFAVRRGCLEAEP